ncbi:MAG TPA: hypothetical protein VH985_10905 [Candidatus Binatia bacterium]|jgi:hypothetical protein
MAADGMTPNMTDEQKATLSDWREGTIDRRSALQKLMLLGASASTAYFFIGELASPTQAQLSLDPKFNPELAARQFRRLKTIVTSKPVLDLIRSLSRTSSSYERKELMDSFSRELSTPRFYSGLGVSPAPPGEVPTQVRFSMRVFEEKDPSQIIYQAQFDSRAPGLTPAHFVRHLVWDSVLATGARNEQSAVHISKHN